MKYHIHLCIRRNFFSHFLSQSQGATYTCYWNFKNAFKSREIDPKHRYFQHPVYVMAKLLLREVTVLFACT